MSDDLSVDQLLATSNEASRQVRNLFISFGALLVYLALVIGATTDVDLLLNARTQLPLLSIELPIEGIFAVAPFLLFVIHTDLLMQVLLLRKKLAHLQEAIDTISPQKFRERRLDSVDQFLYTQSVTGRHLPTPMRGIIVTTCVLVLFGLPLVLLLAFQLRYLPAHDPSITAWHRCLVLADCAVLAYVGINLARSFSETLSFGIAVPVLLLAFIAPLVTLFLFVIPGERLDFAALRPVTQAVFGPDLLDAPSHWDAKQDVPSRVTQLSQLSSRLFHRNLELSSATLVAKGPSDAILAAYISSDRPTSAAWREQAVGIDLSGRDLRFANLRGARMPRANLRGANLSGANLSSADLDDAVLDGAIAIGSNFGGARMRRASLQHAVLVGSNFYQSKLIAANLSQAKVTAASFVETELIGTILPSAELDGVWIINSELRGAFAQSAQMRSALIEMSSLRAASFQGVNLGGAQFGSNGTDVNLAYLLDLSDVTFEPAPKAVWDAARERIEEQLGAALVTSDSKLLQGLLSRIASAEKRTVTELTVLEHSNDLILSPKTLQNARVAGLDFFDAISSSLKPASQVRDTLVKHLVTQGCKSRDMKYGFRLRAGLDKDIGESAFLEAVNRQDCKD